MLFNLINFGELNNKLLNDKYEINWCRILCNLVFFKECDIIEERSFMLYFFNLDFYNFVNVFNFKKKD